MRVADEALVVRRIHDAIAFRESLSIDATAYRLVHGEADLLPSLIVDRYGGDPAGVWTSAATGEELVRRIGQLPGFGATKAQIFAALLGKQLGVRPPGWQEATGPFGQEGSRISVADITDRESLAEVRAYKQQRKAAAKAAR